MKILLIKSSNLSAKSKGATPPLGLMYIASYVRRKRNDEVKIIDTRLYKEPLKIVNDNVLKFKPDIVGVSALTFEASSMYQIAHVIKQLENIPVVVGGPYPTSIPREIINNKDIDIVVVGEGEYTFKEIIDAVETGNTLDAIDGIVYKDQGMIKVNKPRALIDNVDLLPFPAWDLAELSKYENIYSTNGIRFRPYMVFLTSRGCPFHCSYCHSIMGKRFRARSAENVLAEMEILIKTYHIYDFIFQDDIPNYDKDRIKAIFMGIIDRHWQVHLYFTNGMRSDMLDEELIYLMKKAGTSEIAIAVETASPRLQKMVKKNLNLDKVKKMIDICVDSGMFVLGLFMLGFPTETEEELKATIDFACQSRLHEALFFLVTPFEDTELYQQIKALGRVPVNLRPEDYDYHAMPYNLSNIPDKRLHRLYTMAWIKFYFNPIRIIRILRTRMVLRDLPYLFILVIKDMFMGLGNKAVAFQQTNLVFKREPHSKQ